MKYKLKPIEANPIGGFRMMMCHEDEVRELEASTNKAIELIRDLFDDRCNTCRIFNPQHKDCISCGDMEYFRERLSEITGVPYSEMGER